MHLCSKTVVTVMVLITKFLTCDFVIYFVIFVLCIKAGKDSTSLNIYQNYYLYLDLLMNEINAVIILQILLVIIVLQPQ